VRISGYLLIWYELSRSRDAVAPAAVEEPPGGRAGRPAGAARAALPRDRPLAPLDNTTTGTILPSRPSGDSGDPQESVTEKAPVRDDVQAGRR
jgi:hypothetical protein